MEDEVGIFGDLDSLRVPTSIDLCKSVFESSRLRFVDDVYVLSGYDIHCVAGDLTWIHSDLELHGASDIRKLF